MPSDRLDGWEEIATYLGKSVSTVQRWARERGLPIRRFPASQKTRTNKDGVFAVSAEIDAWLQAEMDSLPGLQLERVDALPELEGSPSESGIALEDKLVCESATAIEGPNPEEDGPASDLPVASFLRRNFVFVAISSVLYGLLYSLSLAIEVAYEFNSFLWLVVAGCPLTLMWFFVTSIFGFHALAGRDRGWRRLAWGLAVFFFAALADFLAIGSLLPATAVTRTGFQALSARAAFLKDTVAALLAAIFFMAHPFTFVRSLDESSWAGRAPFSRESMYTRLGATAASLVLVMVFWLVGTTHLLDNLASGQYAGAFQILVLLRGAVLFALGILSISWCYRAAEHVADGDTSEVSSSAGQSKVHDQGSAWRRLGKPRYALGMIALAVALLGGGLWVGWLVSHPSPNPISASVIENNKLVVLSSDGHVLWTKLFHEYLDFDPADRAVLRVEDLDRDSRNEVLFTPLPRTNIPGYKHRLVCYNQDGSVRWEFVPGAEVLWKGFQYSNSFKLWAFATGRMKDGRKFTAVVANHTPYFPSQTAILDPGGKLIGEYWHTGYVFALEVMDLDGDGSDELILGGINNVFQRPSLAIIDHDIAHSVSPVPDGYAPGFAKGKERAYFVFPRTDVSDVLAVDSRVKQVRQTEANQIFVALELGRGVPDPFERLYCLDRQFRTVRLDFPQSFISIHEQLRQERKLDHQVDEAEKQKLLVLEPVPPK